MKVGKQHFKEYAGVLTAFIVVLAFCSIGFIVMGAEIVSDKIITLPRDWVAAMLSLASAGLGYLIGKNEKDIATAKLPHTCSACGEDLDKE